MAILKYFRQPAFSDSSSKFKLQHLQSITKKDQLEKLQTELCFYVVLKKGISSLSEAEKNKLLWILTEPFQEKSIASESFLNRKTSKNTLLIEIGPRLNFSTPFSTNAVSICHSVELTAIERIEISIRYLLTFNEKDHKITTELENKLVDALHDRMTQCRYLKPIESFELDVKPEPWFEVDILNRGKEALMEVNQDMGLALDEWDLNYYTNMFKDHFKRNPTSVECFDLAQSNSEHSRHWFFKGELIIDGVTQVESLIDLVIDTQTASNPNNVIKFSDNSSAIEGFTIPAFLPKISSESSSFCKQDMLRHIIFTAETHNFPTGVAPFSGATTGTGGRIRDVHAAGRGAHVVAGTAGYSFGNLQIPGYDLPWEDSSFTYPTNFAPPVEIAVEASNGASDYGNKFGEPVLAGFARSFGMKMPSGERREYIKPIMFSGGIGTIDGDKVKKLTPEIDMEVVKLGGPVFRIGVGGGAASSVQVQGDNKEELDFVAVQRGDAEMEQKLNRVIRSCIEMGIKNPICSIHDQGAGGNGNVLKEIVEPVGAVIYTKSFQLGDPTLNTLELWGAEYQESNAILVRPEDKLILQKIGKREKCPICFVGKVTGDGKITLVEGQPGCDYSEKCNPVALDLAFVLGKMPNKMFHLETKQELLQPLSLPDKMTASIALHRVLRLPSVASKRYLTNKVDRCVTGLVAQQQCVGPLHTPLADVAVTSLSYFDKLGSATAIGEQPIKGLLNPAIGARMSVAEAVTNLLFARVSSLQDVKCSGNWMWAAKLPSEGAALHKACKAMAEIMKTLGIAVDGGKDSLSMAARVGQETVKAPGTLVISTYAPCPDINSTVTPDLKCPNGKGCLLHVDLAGTQSRLGGTALAQVFNQLGDEAPDVDNPEFLRSAFGATQVLITEGKLISGHDISDGGVITCLLEMAFAGNCGVSVDFAKKGSAIEVLFAEEVGWVIEVTHEDVVAVIQAYQNLGVSCSMIGHSHGFGPEAEIQVAVHGTVVIEDKMVNLRNVWEETSFQLEKRQTNPECVVQEQNGLLKRTAPPYKISFDLTICKVVPASVPKVAILREEGTNGDREMAAAFYLSGFEVWDVTVVDLIKGNITLDQFRGLIFPGGFSYADVLGSAKGWAAAMLFHKNIQQQMEAFRRRSDTFSLGVCNGCQLLGLLGWVAPDSHSEGKAEDLSKQGVVLTHNLSERFECRFSTVRIEKSKSIMLSGMEGSVLGVWVAHGEGRFVFKNKDIFSETVNQNLVSLRYVDDNGEPTTEYPLNPNGSVDGIAGICSADGRHLAMMPHPERCVLPWQWAWKPHDWKKSMKTSPWLHMFHNAFLWCIEEK